MKNARARLGTKDKSEAVYNVQKVDTQIAGRWGGPRSWEANRRLGTNGKDIGRGLFNSPANSIFAGEFEGIDWIWIPVASLLDFFDNLRQCSYLWMYVCRGIGNEYPRTAIGS